MEGTICPEEGDKGRGGFCPRIRGFISLLLLIRTQLYSDTLSTWEAAFLSLPSHCVPNHEIMPCVILLITHIRSVIQSFFYMMKYN